MEAENFYEIKVGPTEILLRVKAREGGKGANLKDIQQELTGLEISYRMDHLFDIYRRSSNQFETLSKRETTEYELRVTISADGYEAKMTVTPPQVGEDQLTPAKIKTALEKASVEKGIQYDEIKRLMAEKIENEPVVVAKGKPAVFGKDGWIEFNPENESGKSVVAEENRVDYKELNLIKSVEEGHLIGTIYPPTNGSDGYDVRGKVIKGSNGKRAKYRLGNNVRKNEDGTEIYAANGGFVVFAAEKISVEDVLELPNVDSESGNVRFTGVIKVKGQVEDGFTVEGSQGVEINGTVGKATIKSRGEIRIRGGAFGARVTSGKTIRGKFFSECELHAGENLIAEEYLLHCDVQAGNAVLVTKVQEGFITGGVVRASNSVWTPVLGSQSSEESTRIEVGAGIKVRRRFQELEDEIERDRGNFDKLRKNIRVLQKHKESKDGLQGPNQEAFEKYVAAAETLRNRLQESAREHRNLFTILAGETSEDGFVFVAEVANPGAQVQIKRAKMNLVSPLQACAFKIQHDEIKAQDYGEALRRYKLQFGKPPS